MIISDNYWTYSCPKYTPIAEILLARHEAIINQ
jgi:hypothetical protein